MPVRGFGSNPIQEVSRNPQYRAENIPQQRRGSPNNQQRSSSEGSGSDKGAVSGTSSEESDTQASEGFTIKDLSQVKWTPKLEASLEEMLVRNQFDFKSSAKEFERQLNKAEVAANKTMFRIDAKTLQLRWTDIEIRRHVMPKMHKEEEDKNRANPI